MGRPVCDIAILERVLEAVCSPVWIVAKTGTILLDNTPARGAGRELADAARRASSGDIDDPRFAVSHVRVDEAIVSLVVARAASPDAALPPSLARIASLVAAGHSDKDIARELGKPLSTVRTYMRRIYTRLGVRSRIALARRWGHR